MNTLATQRSKTVAEASAAQCDPRDSRIPGRLAVTR